MSALGLVVTAAVAAFALLLMNPHWSRFAYMLRWKVFPGTQPARPEGFTGTWRDWKPDGQLEFEYQMVNGQEKGWGRHWHHEGYHEGLVRENFTAPEADMAYTRSWHRGGEKASVLYRIKRQFLGTEWYRSGRKRRRHILLDPEAELGFLTEWHENGQKKQEGYSLGGYFEGKQTIWDPDGKVVREIWAHGLKGLTKEEYDSLPGENPIRVFEKDAPGPWKGVE